MYVYSTGEKAYIGNKSDTKPLGQSGDILVEIDKDLDVRKVYKYDGSSWILKNTVDNHGSINDDVQGTSELDGVYTQLGDIPNQSYITEKTSKSYVDNLVASVNASPKGVYVDLTAVTTAFPSGNNNIYITSGNGHWCYWNGSAWTDGGVYQATEIPKGSLSSDRLNFITLINLFNYTDAVTGHLHLDTNGAIGSINTGETDFFTSPIYAVTAGNVFSIKTTNTETYSNIGVGFYDASGNFVSKQTIPSWNSSLSGVTVPAGATQMRFTARKTDGYGANYQTVTMYTKTSTPPATFLPYGTFAFDSTFSFSESQISTLSSALGIPALNLLTDIDGSSKFFMPTNLYLIQNRCGKRKLKLENILNAYNMFDFYIDRDGANIYTNDKNYIILDDSIAGSAGLNVKVKNCKNFSTIYTKSPYNLKVIGSATNPATVKNVLIIGDSFTDNGYLPCEVKNILVNGLGLTNLNFIGRKSDTDGSVTCLNEGTGGITLLDYIKTDNAQGRGISWSNPFLYNGFVDFASYMSGNGFTGNIDYCVIECGVNDILALNADVTTTKNRMKSLIDYIHMAYPSCKIFAVGQKFASEETLYINSYTWNNTIMDLNSAYQTLCEDSNYSSFCKYVDIGVMFDKLYGSTHSISAPYVGSSDTIIKITDWLHPCKSGYYMIAENIASAIAWNL